MNSKKILYLFVPLLILGGVFFAFKDKYIYPLLAHWRLGTDGYYKELKENAGRYKDVLWSKRVWNSKRLAVSPPKIEKKIARRVLSADPNTWVDINLSTQTLCLFHGGGTNCFTVSTGLPYTPTPTGTYYIWTKIPSTLMAGPGYYLPGVPWTMYFYKGYGIHGTYWHNNFGHPMSHGCVNMRTPEAQFVYDRVAVGTRVVIHY